MNKKIIQLTIPFIFAFLILGMVFFLIGSSSQARASDDIKLKFQKRLMLTNKPVQLLSVLLVNTLEDELNSDGDCSLRGAITAANNNVPVDTCPAGEAVSIDTISFDVAGIILLNNQLEVTEGGPLEIDGGSVITLSGDGGHARVMGRIRERSQF